MGWLLSLNMYAKNGFHQKRLFFLLTSWLDMRTSLITESVLNSKIMHQSIPPAPNPPTPPGWSPGISIFFGLDGKFLGVGTRAVKSPRVGTKKEGKCPVLCQHRHIFHWSHSQIATILSILMCNFFLGAGGIDWCIKWDTPVPCQWCR